MEPNEVYYFSFQVLWRGMIIGMVCRRFLRYTRKSLSSVRIDALRSISVNRTRHRPGTFGHLGDDGLIHTAGPGNQSSSCLALTLIEVDSHCTAYQPLHVRWTDGVMSTI